MSLNITQKVLKQLLSGQHLAGSSISQDFNHSNPSMLINSIEAKGVPIERIRVGRTVVYALSRNIGNTDRIRARLLAGDTLTVSQISEEYGLGAPTSVIYELRKRGLNIKTTRIASETGTSIAMYHL